MSPLSIGAARPPRVRVWGLHYSPFTEKARWALDHHELAYAYVEHVPLLGEAALRLRGGRSVPFMIDEAGPHVGAAVIARRAETKSTGRTTPLFADAAGITQWETIIDKGLAAGRALVLKATFEDTRAQEEAMAGILPRRMIPHAHALSRMGARHIARKYRVDTDDDGAALAELQQCADAVWDALEGRDAAYLVGSRFSYADICAAALVQCISPPDYLPLAPATRECWTRTPLLPRFERLIAWRDALVDEHRKSRAYAS